MIYSLKGVITEKTLESVVIEVGGVGYLVAMPLTVAGQIEHGKEYTIYTYMNVTENDVSLFGFASKEQLACFKMLTGVSGVGPRAGLAILSVLDPQDANLAIAAGDHKAFTAASGVGPKLAQRIVLELKDKVAKGFSSEGMVFTSSAGTPAQMGAPSQAVAALVSLGYTQSEAASAVARLAPELPVEELIRQALRQIAGGR